MIGILGDKDVTISVPECYNGHLAGGSGILQSRGIVVQVALVSGLDRDVVCDFQSVLL